MQSCYAPDRNKDQIKMKIKSKHASGGDFESHHQIQNFLPVIKFYIICKKKSMTLPYQPAADKELDKARKAPHHWPVQFKYHWEPSTPYRTLRTGG